METLSLSKIRLYGCLVPPTLCDVEELLYVQEAQLDKFRQELVATTVAANVAHTNLEDSSSRGAYSGGCGRGNKFNQGRGRGRGRSTSSNRPTRQLCGKYDTPYQLIGTILIRTTCLHRTTSFTPTRVPSLVTNKTLAQSL